MHPTLSPPPARGNPGPGIPCAPFAAIPHHVAADPRIRRGDLAVLAALLSFAYRRDRVKTTALMLATAALGATFVGMQAFEWTKLIHEGVRPWSNPWGAAQFGSTFFMITGFHGTHVSFGVLFLLIVARKVWQGDYDQERRGFFTSRRGSYEAVEIMGLYWHFVDLVWVFIFAFFYLW